jgi:hypothetical protein
VVIQGRAQHDSWVKRFEVEYSFAMRFLIPIVAISGMEFLILSTSCIVVSAILVHFDILESPTCGFMPFLTEHMIILLLYYVDKQIGANTLGL